MDYLLLRIDLAVNNETNFTVRKSDTCSDASLGSFLVCDEKRHLLPIKSSTLLWSFTFVIIETGG